jgi:hypothetical protein
MGDCFSDGNNGENGIELKTVTCKKNGNPSIMSKRLRHGKQRQNPEKPLLIFACGVIPMTDQSAVRQIFPLLKAKWRS